jgi:hypothetical protein
MCDFCLPEAGTALLDVSLPLRHGGPGRYTEPASGCLDGNSMADQLSSKPFRMNYIRNVPGN